MPHIHDKPGQIDHTVTAYIARVDGNEPQLLLHMHKKYHRLMPVGGHIELDETPWSAVAHEIREESGYDFNQLQVMQPKLRIGAEEKVVTHPQPLRMNTHEAAPRHFHSDAAYLFLASDEPKYAPDDGESTDIRWLARADVEKLSDGEIYIDAKQTALAIFDDFLAEWEPVPATDFSLQKYWQKQ